tara:strand:- start:312 stop:731 length:420 start_codon:yes stop_codon:yes gene_type:complete
MVRNLLFSITIFFKGLFGSKIEGTQNSGITEAVPLSWTKQVKKNLWDLYNKDVEDKIDYTNTHEHHHSNFKHLDDANDPEFGGIAEQVGLLYEEDGQTPLNAAEVYDMTYEEYTDYKEKILPFAKKRKITMEEIEELFG